MPFAAKVTLTVTSNPSLLPSTQSNFTVLVSVTHDYLKTVANGGKVQNTCTFNGQTVPADVVFKLASDLSGSALSFDIASYDPVAGTIEAWVLKTSLALGDVLYCGIGDASITTYQGGSVGAAWDSNHLAVYHLANGTTLSVKDSTANGYDLTNNGSWGAAAGKVDGGTAKSNGSSQYLNNAAIVTPDSITISFWQKYNTADVNNNLSPHAFEWGGLGGSTAAPRLLNHAPFTDSILYFDYADATSNQGRVSTSYASYLDAWVYVTLVYDNSSGIHAIYLNGSLIVSNTHSSANPNLTGIDINSSDTSFGRQCDIRQLDEFRISNAGRSTDRITVEYSNQNAPTTFIAASFALVTAPSPNVMLYTGAVSPTDVILRSAGTIFTQSLGSILTPAASIVRNIGYPLAASIAPAAAILKAVARALTASCAPAASIIKAVSRSLSGSETPASSLASPKTSISSPSGALTPSASILKRTARSLSGSLASSATVLKSSARNLLASIAPAATIVRASTRSFAASLTPTSLLSAAHAMSQAVSGGLGMAGGLIKLSARSLAATLSSAATLLKSTARNLAAAMTPAASVASVKASSLSVAGSLSMASTLARQIARQFLSSLSSAGDLARATANVLGLSGILTMSGGILKAMARTLASSLAPSSVIGSIKAASLALVATLSSAGQIGKATARSLAASMISSAMVTKRTAMGLVSIFAPTAAVSFTRNSFAVALSSAVALSASLVKVTNRQLSSAITSASILAKTTARQLQSACSSLGSATGHRYLQLSLAATMALSGVLSSALLAVRSLSGNMASIGSIIQSIFKVLAGVLGLDSEIEADPIFHGDDISTAKERIAAYFLPDLIYRTVTDASITRSASSLMLSRTTTDAATLRSAQPVRAVSGTEEVT